MKYAIENGIIDLSYVQNVVEMRKKKKILENHTSAVWHATDGYWKTYLPKLDRGRKLVKRKSKDEIEKVIIEYWENLEHISFKSRYRVWMERQKACGRSDNTIYKYIKDYNRFFKGDKFEEYDIRNITDETISIFISRLLSQKEIPWRALKAMYGYMNGVFEKSIVDGLIENNPCKYVDLPIFRKYCTEPMPKTTEDKILSVEEKNTILKESLFRESVANYAVEFSLYVGMRVGELSALRWDDIDFENKTITVRHSEKYNQLSGERTIENTKNNLIRKIPLTDEMENVLEKIKRLELQNGIYGEFVFMTKHGRMSRMTIIHAAHRMTGKGIHSIRRTLNSNMRSMGVSVTVAASMLGHSEKVNDMNYTYDTYTMEQKREIIQNAAKLNLIPY